FQAEDGIRDRNVTGVQTCALPIYCHLLWSDYVCNTSANVGTLLGRTHSAKVAVRGYIVCPPKEMAILQDTIESGWVYTDRNLNRSEERRVGKEGRERERTE